MILCAFRGPNSLGSRAKLEHIMHKQLCRSKSASNTYQAKNNQGQYHVRLPINPDMLAIRFQEFIEQRMSCKGKTDCYPEHVLENMF